MSRWLGSVALFVTLGLGLEIEERSHSRTSGALCSYLDIGPYFRGVREVYFIGQAASDSIRVTAKGSIGDAAQRYWGPRELPPLHGQIVRLERVGPPWTALIPAHTRSVIMIPWGTAGDCTPVAWSQGAIWIPPGGPELMVGTLRDSTDWVAGLPTLDVYTAGSATPTAVGLIAYDGWLRNPRDNHLTPEQALELFSVLPTRDSAMSFPVEAMRPLMDWAARNPELTDKHPANEVISSNRGLVENQLVRLRPSPIAGTYRYVLTRPGADSVVLYARTETNPTLVIRGEGGDRNRPIRGYALMGRCALAVANLPSDGDEKRGVPCDHTVSTTPVVTSADSTVWRGESETVAKWRLGDDRPPPGRLFRPDVPEVTSYYHMSGHWIAYSSGRVRFEWIMRAADTVFVTVRGERISRDVLKTVPR